MQRKTDVDTFYDLLSELEVRTGGRRLLGECVGRMRWPTRGVYFFFESGEQRKTKPSSGRVVRIGTHALTEGSRTSLWNRISQHRGSLRPYGGNHRGSIFRLLAGEAMYRKDPSLQLESWGNGNAPKYVRDQERALEEHVSKYLGEMTVMFLDVPDDPGPLSARGVIERNSIALLSSYNKAASDQSSNWLGQYSGRESVRQSGLWNNNHVNEKYDVNFIKILSQNVEQMQKF